MKETHNWKPTGVEGQEACSNTHGGQHGHYRTRLATSDNAAAETARLAAETDELLAELAEIEAEERAARLEYLRDERRAERISYGELVELESLAQYIDPSDVELLEAAGVAEGASDDRRDAMLAEEADKDANASDFELVQRVNQRLTKKIK